MTKLSQPPIERHRTPRLLLRRPVMGDLPSVVALFSRPELVAHRPRPVPDSPEASSARLAREIGHWREHGFGRWALEHDGTLIGFGGLTYRTGVEDLNISYHLDPVVWGRGFASEMVAETLSMAFGPLGAKKVIGLVRPANAASRRVLERSGFRPEGGIELDGAPCELWARYPHSELPLR